MTTKCPYALQRNAPFARRCLSTALSDYYQLCDKNVSTNLHEICRESWQRVNRTFCYMGTQFPSQRAKQTDGWIKMPLGTAVGLGPGHIVLDGEPALPSKAHSPTIFGPCLLWPNGWMDQDATWYGGRHRPRRHYVRGGPSFPYKGAQPLLFGPCLLWPNGRLSQILMSTCYV